MIRANKGAALMPPSHSLGGSPDEGIHRSPLETVLLEWEELRPSLFSEYR